MKPSTGVFRHALNERMKEWLKGRKERHLTWSDVLFIYLFIYLFFTFRAVQVSIMFPKTVSIIFAMCFISIGSGLNADGGSGYEAVVKCIQTGWKAMSTNLKMKAGHADTDAKKIEVACTFLRVSFRGQSGPS